jgi:IS30 family transposase
LTLNDRASGFTKIGLLESKNAIEKSEKTIALMTTFASFLHTVTSDNGKEFSAHKEVSARTGVAYFFAQP